MCVAEFFFVWFDVFDSFDCHDKFHFVSSSSSSSSSRNWTKTYTTYEERKKKWIELQKLLSLQEEEVALVKVWHSDSHEVGGRWSLLDEEWND